MEKKIKQKSWKRFRNKNQKILDTFTKTEKLGKENSKKYKDCLKEIFNLNSHLINNILNYVIDDLASTNMRENIFKIMRKLYHLNKEDFGS